MYLKVIEVSILGVPELKALKLDQTTLKKLIDSV